jgi:hypothetical protein
VHRRDTSEQQRQRLAHQDQVGVVGDVRAGGAKMQERPGGRGLFPERVDVCHDVVAQTLFELRRARQVGGVEVRAQLGDGVGRNLEPELALALHQRQPQAAPQPDAAPLAPERLHRGRGVAGGKRRFPVHTPALARAASLLQSERN